VGVDVAGTLVTVAVAVGAAAVPSAGCGVEAAPSCGAFGAVGANDITLVGVGEGGGSPDGGSFGDGVGGGVGEGAAGGATVDAGATGVEATGSSAGSGTSDTSAIPPRPSHAPVRLVPTSRVPSLQRKNNWAGVGETSGRAG
jgi:hypothetical protein